MNMFDAPIPGASLTAEPGNYPWERPPQMEDVDEIADHYLSKLNREEVIDDLLDLVEARVPIEAIASALITSNVSKGLHSIDTGILVGPVVHQFIRTAAESAGIEFVDNLDPERRKAKKEKEKMRNRLKVKLSDISEMNRKRSGAGRMAMEQLPEEEPEEEQAVPMEEQQQAAATQAPVSRGLMSRSV